MSTMGDAVTRIAILGSDYSIKAPAEQQPALAAAAQMLQSRLANNKAQSPGLLGDKLLVLTALQLCAELAELQQSERDSQALQVALGTRIEALVNVLKPAVD
jgi:cell division protein ZapA